MKPPTFAEDSLLVTARIQSPKGVGTGFLLKTNSGRGLLISNRHVLLPDLKSINVAVRTEGETPFGKPVIIEIQITKDNYAEHPNPNMDLAAIDISDTLGDIIPTHLARVVEQAHINSLSHATLGTDVRFIGYPSGNIDETANLPIFRSGMVATLPEQNFNGRPVFLIDAAVFPGSSGSPVFALMRIDKEILYRFVGIICETHIAQFGNIKIPNGLGVVIKGGQLDALILCMEKKPRRLNKRTIAQFREILLQNPQVPKTEPKANG